MAALLADVNGDADALVTVVLDGLDLAFADRDVLAETLAGLDLCRRGALLFSVGEDVAGHLLQGG